MEGMILITSYKLRITNHGKFDWAFAYGNSITAVYFLMHQHFYFDGNYTQTTKSTKDTKKEIWRAFTHKHMPILRALRVLRGKGTSWFQ